MPHSSFPPILLTLAAFRYRAHVVEWLDGDTVRAQDDYGKHLGQLVDYRLQNVDTPEIRSKDPLEVIAGRKAQAYASSLLPPDSWFVAYTIKDTRSFNRYVAIIWFIHPTTNLIANLNEAIRAEQINTNNWGYVAQQPQPT